MPQFWPAKIAKGMKLTMSADQTIPHGTITKIANFVASEDTLGGWDEAADRLTIKEKGDYLIYLQTHTGETDDLMHRSHIYKNGASVASARERGYTNHKTPATMIRLSLVPGDYIEFYIYFYNYTDGGNVVLDSADTLTFAWIEKV